MKVLLSDRVHTKTQRGPGTGISEVIQASEQTLDALRDQREVVGEVTTVALDADAYLRSTETTWDIIIADFPDPSTPDTAKLYSAEFFQLVKRSLNPNGVFCVQASSPYTNRSSFWTVADTLASTGFLVTPIHAHVPTFGEWGWHIASLKPQAFGVLPTTLRYLDKSVLEAAQYFLCP